MRARPVLALAMLAALLGAPSSASAGSALSAPAYGGRDAAAEPASRLDGGVLTVLVLVGLSGVATTAIIGSAVLVRGRQRRGDEPTNPAVAEQAATDAMLERRALRRARVRLPDDPIVAAMGIDKPAPRRRRAPRAGVTDPPGPRR